MSGGGGGIIIIHRIASIPEVPEVDRLALRAIADKNPVSCSLADALKVLRIVWRQIRKP